MDVGAAFVAGPQAFEGVQPCEAALDRPPKLPRSGTVAGAAAGNDRRDTAGPEKPTILVVIVAAVGVQIPGPTPRAAPATPDRGQSTDERDELGDVVAVTAGQRDRRGRSCGVGDQVMLAAGSASIDRARADMVPPFRGRGYVRRRPGHGTVRAGRLRGVRSTLLRAVAATLRPATTRSTDAGRSRPRHRTTRSVAGSSRYLCEPRTGCLPARPGRRPMSARVAEASLAPESTTPIWPIARRSPPNHPRKNCQICCGTEQGGIKSHSELISKPHSQFNAGAQVCIRTPESDSCAPSPADITGNLLLRPWKPADAPAFSLLTRTARPPLAYLPALTEVPVREWFATYHQDWQQERAVTGLSPAATARSSVGSRCATRAR